MNKCKLIKRKGMRKLLIKGVKGQQLSDWATNAINTEEVTGLLRVDAFKKGFVYHLEYDIAGYITFEEFLQVNLNRDTFARILQNILENLKSMEEKHFNQELLLYDMDKIYINPATQRLYFAYVPLQPFENSGTLQEMLLNIIEYSSFEENEDTEYVSEYINILNCGINFSVFDLEEYVKRLMKSITGEDDTNNVQCPKCGAMVPEDTVLCKCGQKLRGFTGNTGGGKVYNMFGDNRSASGKPIRDEEEDTPPVREQEKPADHKPKQDDIPKKQEPEEKTPESGSVKKTGKKPTTVLSLYDEEDILRGFLIRESTGERIELECSPFRIGRESGDLIVDNRYVSDPHMDIITRKNRFFAMDLGSTNKSYIDGEKLLPNQETELHSGCQLKLANEKFQFIAE